MEQKAESADSQDNLEGESSSTELPTESDTEAEAEVGVKVESEDDVKAETEIEVQEKDKTDSETSEKPEAPEAPDGPKAPEAPETEVEPIKGVCNCIQSFIHVALKPMVILDSELKVVTVNDAFCKTFRINPKKAIGSEIYSLNNKRWDMEKLHTILEEILVNGDTIYDFDMDIELSPDESLDVTCNALRLFGSSKEKQMILLAFETIPELKELKELKKLKNVEELEKSEKPEKPKGPKKLKDLNQDLDDSLFYIKETLETTDDGIVVIDTDNIIKVYNQRFLELLGVPQSLMDSKNFMKVFDFIVEQFTDAKSFLSITGELNTNKEAECFDIIETSQKKILEYYSKPQRMGDDIIGRVWSFRDITTRKWAEKALKVTYISFHNILESSVDGIIVMDKEGCTCFFNQAADTMFHGRLDERLHEILSFPLAEMQELQEIAIQRLDGDLGVAEMRIVETEWEGKKAYLAMLRDITARKLINEELKKNRTMLEEKVKERTNELIQAEKMVALGQLVAGVAHEVNNPLAFIKSNTEFIDDVITDIKEKIKDKDLKLDGLDEIKELIKVNVDGINRITLITTALKRFAKPGTEDRNYSDVNQGIKDTLLILRNRFKHRIQVHEDYCELPKVLCNIEHLNQVFINVLLNASESMDLGNVHVKTWFQGDKVYIRISDDGKGIPEKKLGQIFDPFYTTKDGGTGLGLSLSYRIIQAHGGNITAESKVGSGTTITIEIPVECKND
jgi:PAS domain S-box-containing protein